MVQTKKILATSLSLRHLKAARCVATFGNVTRAAAELNKTQSTITKSVNNLEARLGVKLFDRSPRGMALTTHGVTFIQRVREAECQFAIAGEIYLTCTGESLATRANPVFSMDISNKRLAAFLALYNTRNVGLAASQLSVTRAAIYSSIRQLEKLLELSLFAYSGSKITCSGYCETLATHVKLAFSLIGHGLDEIASLNNATQGRVVIGTLPYARTLLIPRSIHRLLEHHPQLQISTREGPYDVLEASLRNGDIDLIIGATRSLGNASTLRTQKLLEDKLAIITRTSHPLATANRVSLKQLQQFGWILPPQRTPARQLFDQFLSKQKALLPQQIVETSSLSTIRGLLFESNRVALLSRHQVYYEEQAGLLTTLPITLTGTSRPIGITSRANTTPSPAAKLFMVFLASTAAQMN